MEVVTNILKEEVGSRLSGFLICETWNWTVSPGLNHYTDWSSGVIKMNKLPETIVQASWDCKSLIPVHWLAPPGKIDISFGGEI